MKYVIADADFYDCDDECDTLTWTNVGEAIGSRLEDLSVDGWDDEIVVYAWTRCVIEDRERDGMARSMLDRFYEYQLEMYANPNEREVPQAAVDAARDFVDNMIDNVGCVWSCYRSKAHDVTINVADWVRENEPEWAEPGHALEREGVASWIAARPASVERDAVNVETSP